MIYFAQGVGGGPVKIGCSDDVPRRVQALGRRYGTPLTILATTEGDREAEREIHARFAGLRLGRTEQFRPTAELLAFIDRPLLVGANPDAVEVMEPTGSDGTLVRIAPDLASMARYLAARRGIAMSDLLTELLRTPLEREFRKAGRDLMPDDDADDGPAKKGKGGAK